MVKITKEERKELFKKEVYIFKEQHSDSFLEQFIEYWTETSKKSIKLRFEDEKFFDIKRRLSTFKSNQNKYSSNYSKPSNQYYGQEVGN